MLYGGSQVGGFISTVPRPLSLEMEERDSMLRRLNLLQERLDQEQRDKVKFQKEVKDILEENRRLKEEVKFLEDPGRDVSFLQPLIGKQESKPKEAERLPKQAADPEEADRPLKDAVAGTEGLTDPQGDCRRSRF